MSDDQLEDLKQYIEGSLAANTDDLKQYVDERISQSESSIRMDMADMKDDIRGLDHELKALDQKMDSGFAGVGEAFDQVHTELASLEVKMDDGFAGVGEAVGQIHTDLTRTDKRLTKLEKAA